MHNVDTVTVEHQIRRLPNNNNSNNRNNNCTWCVSCLHGADRVNNRAPRFFLVCIPSDNHYRSISHVTRVHYRLSMCSGILFICQNNNDNNNNNYIHPRCSNAVIIFFFCHYHGDFRNIIDWMRFPPTCSWTPYYYNIISLQLPHFFFQPAPTCRISPGSAANLHHCTAAARYDNNNNTTIPPETRARLTIAGV